MSDIQVKVRVGQQNVAKVISSVSGSAGGNAVNSINVIGGIASVTQLYVDGLSTFTGLSTFQNDVYINGNLTITANSIYNNLYVSNNAVISGILTVGQSLYYPIGEPFGIAYFNINDQLVSTGSTSTAISETNYILSTNSSGVPTWANVIDGGTY